jgi:hypothetical protein
MTFELSQQQLQVIFDGLILVPYGRAAPVIHELQTQIQAETAKTVAPPDGEST